MNGTSTRMGVMIWQMTSMKEGLGIEAHHQLIIDS